MTINTMMIFAAGRGTRLQPLTDTCPKPLVKVGGKPLIEYHLEQAVRAGVKNVVINVSYLREMIMSHLGDGSRWGLNIQYSIEETALETAGGLVHARHLLGSGPFFICNADIYHEYDLRQCLEFDPAFVHLLMVPNPSEQPKGNFAIDSDGLLREISADNKASSMTYSGIGLYHTDFVDDIDQLHTELAEHQRTPFYLKRWMANGRVKGHKVQSLWCDVGTLDRLNWLDDQLKAKL